ncbi:MAG TPA: glycosyl hydrolase family 65 protein [Flavisolibacter sp.]|nr:glycosyl hydrolase family 65 protein [Flavisolibacter sp.]
MNRILLLSFVLLTHLANAQVGWGDKIRSPREKFAVQKIWDAEKELGLKRGTHVFSFGYKKGPKEGFTITTANNQTKIEGSDETGLLYGCMEFADQLRKLKGYPKTLNISDAPEMVLRGAAIGLQKPTYLPGRHVYEYPYTPETFPWFYDKALWLRTLDSMVENRMNSLYLWNGHPFASLVKLKDYPYAVEVDDATFKKNEEIFSFLTTEADKRGIWVIQMFYNIIVSEPFAKKHNLKTQDRNRPIIPIIADYTRKSITAFVEKYPNVGLMVALGEAMEGVGQDDIDWFTKTIIPGVKDGLKALGKTEEPPIVLRAHDTDAPSVMEQALPLYKNLYTEAKYNGEALTTYTPRGPWAELHQKLASLGSVQIENVHILANLEPFRYGSPDFIQKSVQAMHKVHHGNGLHLYPQASYWDWPYSADKSEKRIMQIDRDWIWYKAWSRYAWKADRNRNEEMTYWSSLLTKQFGANETAAKNILAAYEESGEIAPKLLRRFGITDGNRQTLTLGMFMTQLINPYRYGLFTLLYNSEGPEGEMLAEYAEKEWKGEKHIGETPVQIINEVRVHGKKAVEAIEKAAPFIRTNHDEFHRLRNDMAIYEALANNFASKAEAALLVLRYKYSNDIKDLEKAQGHLRASLTAFEKLVRLTRNTYLYANSMQTQQRKIPIGGNDGNHKHWEEMLPHYRLELANFSRNIDSLKAPKKATAVVQKTLFKNADVKILSNTDGFYSISTGSSLFSDTSTYIKDFAEELSQLNAIKLSKTAQMAEGTTIRFSNAKPVKVLVGYFDSKLLRYLQQPQLEIDASANDYGQAEPKLRNAILISGLPPIHIHTFTFKAGTNTLSLAKGAALVLGFVDDEQPFPVRDAALVSGSVKRELDWLFDSPLSPETLVLPTETSTAVQIPSRQSPSNKKSVGLSVKAQPSAAKTVAEKFADYVTYFNAVDSEYAVNYIPNAKAQEWLSQNIPVFEAPDTTLEKIYYYRWWALRKHLKQTPDGFVFTEFITPIGHAGKHNTVSSGLGHHINELRWLRDQKYLDDYINFWLHVDPKTPKPHLRAFSSWLQWAIYNRYLVHPDKSFLQKNIAVLDEDYKAWEREKGTPSGLFWQFDVRDAMEESISGSRKELNRRPTINSYMYGNAIAMSKMGKLLAIDSLIRKYDTEALRLRKLVHDSLWDNKEAFFKVRHTNGQLNDAKEAIGFIPWYFNLPAADKKYADQWSELIDTFGFNAPWGITTAERRHPLFRTHGSGHGCEWDGAVWPYATTQTLKGLSNLLNNYTYHAKMSPAVFYDELHKYAWSHQKKGLPYLGEYQDETTGEWLKGDNPRSSYYNHSGFADLIINDLIGLKPREDNVLEISPLIPKGAWDWFLLDKVPYHGRLLTIRWDKDGKRYGKGAGFFVYADGKQVYGGKELKAIKTKL